MFKSILIAIILLAAGVFSDLVEEDYYRYLNRGLTVSYKMLDLCRERSNDCSTESATVKLHCILFRIPMEDGGLVMVDSLLRGSLKKIWCRS